MTDETTNRVIDAARACADVWSYGAQTDRESDLAKALIAYDAATHDDEPCPTCARVRASCAYPVGGDPSEPHDHSANHPPACTCIHCCDETCPTCVRLNTRINQLEDDDEAEQLKSAVDDCLPDYLIGEGPDAVEANYQERIEEAGEELHGWRAREGALKARVAELEADVAHVRAQLAMASDATAGEYAGQLAALRARIGWLCAEVIETRKAGTVLSSAVRREVEHARAEERAACLRTVYGWQFGEISALIRDITARGTK